MNHKSEPRFLLSEDSICYGCPYYCHWTKTRDPVFFEKFDMDEYGGVCDTDVPCINGANNQFDKEEGSTIKLKDINEMVNKKSWKEFIDNGFLWWINMILHTFGWAITYEVDDDGSITDVYPARVKFRGFGETSNSEGYIKVSQYLNANSGELLKESEE